MPPTTRRPGTDIQTLDAPAVRKLLATYQRDLTAILPAHTNPETFMGLAAAAVKRSAELRRVAALNPASLILALRRCAYLGHVVLPKQFYLVPFNDRQAVNGVTVVGMEAWQGVVQRMLRASGGTVAPKVNLGYDGDPVLRFNPTTMLLPEHEFDEFAAPVDRGLIKAAYAWAVMPGGTVSHVAWLNRYELNRRRAMAKSADRLAAFWGEKPVGEGPEGKNTAAMCRKSALLALEPFTPVSAEFLADLGRRAQRADDGAFGDLGAGPVTDPDDDGDVWDGEEVPSGDPADG